MSSIYLASALARTVVAEGAAPVLPFPPIVFAIISAAVFIVLAFVMWSYRDVANRHSHKIPGHSHGAQGAHGDAGHGPDHH